MFTYPVNFEHQFPRADLRKAAQIFTGLYLTPDGIYNMEIFLNFWFNITIIQLQLNTISSFYKGPQYLTVLV